MALVVGAGHSDIVEEHGLGVEVHRVGDRTAIHQGGGDADSGGWAAIPPGTRRSTYEIPEYQNAARAFAKPTIDAIESAPIDNPGTTKRPGNPGVQYVGIPQFEDVGNQCTEQFAAVIRRQVVGRCGAGELPRHRFRCG